MVTLEMFSQIYSFLNFHIQIIIANNFLGPTSNVASEGVLVSLVVDFNVQSNVYEVFRSRPYAFVISVAKVSVILSSALNLIPTSYQY